MSKARLYCGNLSWNTVEADLRTFFSSYDLVDVKVIIDRETGRSRGFAFVELKNESEVQDAIADLDGRELDGRDLRVSVAIEKPKSSRGKRNDNRASE